MCVRERWERERAKKEDKGEAERVWVKKYAEGERENKRVTRGVKPKCLKNETAYFSEIITLLIIIQVGQYIGISLVKQMIGIFNCLLVVSIGLFWVSFMPFSYNGVYLRP